MITRIDHVAVAVKSIADRLGFWTEALGLPLEGQEAVETEKVKVAFLRAGDSRIELLEASDEASTVQRHIERRGEGIHHLTFEVADLDDALEDLRRRDVILIGEAPRVGSGSTRVAFVHPQSTGGVLVELVEAPARREPRTIEEGALVLAYLRDPQEKLWGVLCKLDAAGLVLEGIDLGSFDDWVAQIERDEETVVGPSVQFVPMARVERILLDRSSGHLPSLAERFERRTGRAVLDVLAPSTCRN